MIKMIKLTDVEYELGEIYINPNHIVAMWKVFGFGDDPTTRIHTAAGEYIVKEALDEILAKISPGPFYAR